MTKTSLLSYALGAATLIGSSSAANLFADGGFETDTNTPCAASWEYKAEDKTVTTVSGCVAFSDFLPYPFVGGGSVSDVLPPTDQRTDSLKWCSTGTRYNAFNANNREIWGYCLDKDLALKLEPGNYADGGYQSTPVACSGAWSYKVKLDNGTNLFYEYTGCAEMSEVQPFPFVAGSQSDINDLLDPTDDRTVTTSWCSTTDIYNPTPGNNNIANRENWGYCLKVSNTNTSTTPAPVAAPATGSPTAQTTTKSPTSTTTTQSPTPAPTPATLFFADGGFTDEQVPCMGNWTYKNKNTNVIESVSGCVSIDDYSPWPFATNDPSVVLSSGVADPTNAATNNNMWCSTSDVYNPFPENTVSNREQWGYCLEVKASTGAPTGSQQTTKSPTPLVSTSPVTSSPVASDGNNNSTTSPTPDDGVPKTSNDVKDNSDGPSGGAIAGIVIAVIVIALVVVAAVLAVQKTKQKRDNAAAKADTKQDPEQPKTSGMF